MVAAVDHPPVTARTRRLLAFLLVPLLGAVVAGTVVLWPSGRPVTLAPSGTPIHATIVGLRRVTCADTAPAAGVRCLRAEARLVTGGRVALDERPDQPGTDLAVGDQVVVTKVGDTYALAGHRRDDPLAAVAGAAAIALLLVARRRGLFLLVALATTGGVLVAFAVPAVLDGRSPLAVGVVGGALVATAVLVLGRGVTARSATALVGTLAGLAIAGGVGHLVVDAAHLAGLDATPGYLRVGRGAVPMDGLLLAGLVLGSVGALVDLTIRQVDATWDLRATDPTAGWRGVAAAGRRRGGHDLADVGATLVLAYAGAALPVLVLLAAGDQSVLDAVRGEVVAVEVVRALVGLLALSAAVPVTAALAAAIVVREAGSTGSVDPRRFRSKAERDIWDLEDES
ncbi:MAG: YibE/F-like protein [Actinomycetia bacterium]|nr:YibE/F-like protein [Actinomycetes bacterium]